MKYYSLVAGTTLYHGSTRLYHINCYLRAHSEQVADYLRTSQLSTNTGTEVVLRKLLPIAFQRALLRRYEQYLSQPKETLRPVTQEILYAMTVGLLEEYNLTQYSVRAIWNTLFERRRTDLLSFAEQLEDQRTLDEAFRVDFYSTMGLPVQFFTPSREVASIYADRDPVGQVLTYSLQKSLSLPDLSDQDTVDELTRTVYSSEERFPLEWLLDHTASKTYADLRLEMLLQTLGFIDWEDMMDLLNDVCEPYLPQIRTRPYYKPQEREILIFYATNWSVTFSKELLTPRVLWDYVNWRKLQGRLTIYDSDALLLRVMVDHGEYKGYYSPEEEEMVIVEPYLYGTIDTYSIETDPEKCPYTINSQERSNSAWSGRMRP